MSNPTPATMAALLSRRQCASPAPVRTFRRNPGSTLPLGAMAPAVKRRAAYDVAVVLLREYALATVTTWRRGKHQRWQPETLFHAHRLLEGYFLGGSLKSEDYISPGALLVVRRIFVATCEQYKLQGTTGQNTAWFRNQELTSRF